MTVGRLSTHRWEEAYQLLDLLKAWTNLAGRRTSQAARITSASKGRWDDAKDGGRYGIAEARPARYLVIGRRDAAS
ncbi:hypothetical protein CPLU01_00910 [Colletotrichum plurivorum]|uniref:Uncharacterized protein n=1 Tax=Colletotrichum plurivorum TaxID=2175906 RepID=A0A8H6U4W2_9PEZI|nr:hypothetical protein CPLU01_00910 [Colletotrichum plurivorum]